ncbi:putative galactinol--sucrose galactosyltransferase 2 isoform X2 [Silene latifolia]
MAIFIEDNCLLVNGIVVLTGVPGNIAISPAPYGSAFLGASSLTPSSRHVFSIGTFQGFNFLSLFRFKIWWMTPKIGTSGSDVRVETQLLLIEAKEEYVVLNEAGEPSPDDIFYILVLPVLEGPFRASLQGTQTNELQFCVESGDSDVQTSQVSESVFINSGDNPYQLIKNSIKILAAHKGTFRHLDDKKLPVHLDWFGWCTWDAFYKDVNPAGIRQGFESLSQGGYAPRFLVIDEGWQETFNEYQKDDEKQTGDIDFGFETRLKNFKENDKFRDLASDDYTTLPEFIKFLKQRYDLKYVYVWHAILGCWGGVLTSSEAFVKFTPQLVNPIQSPGNIGNLRDIAMDGIEKYGMGVVDPERIGEFYNDYHSYIASIGVDGVKVDIQNVLETIGSNYGGRVRMTAMYQRGLEEAVEKNFVNNNVICSMSHDSDLLFSSQKTAVIRSYEDFMPREQYLQTVHIAAVSFNSLFLGEFGVADWDMFQSLHYAADFHAASRAVGGCSVYVSDKPGNHDFDILKRLVLPDGSILRAKYAGRPTRDCLFKDPVMDGITLLKIWNLNQLSGIIGVFNCQGVGVWPWYDNLQDTSTPEVISGRVSPNDVEFLEDIAGDEWQGDCAVYAFYSGSLNKVSKTGNLEVSLGMLKCELFTVCPIRVFSEAVHFAPIGLLDMYNSGGAIESWSSIAGSGGSIVKMKARGCGRFGAYSSKTPRYCTVDTKNEEFTFSPEDGLLTIMLEGDCQVKDIRFVY